VFPDTFTPAVFTYKACWSIDDSILVCNLFRKRSDVARFTKLWYAMRCFVFLRDLDMRIALYNAAICNADLLEFEEIYGRRALSTELFWFLIATRLGGVSLQS